MFLGLQIIALFIFLTFFILFIGQAIRLKGTLAGRVMWGLIYTFVGLFLLLLGYNYYQLPIVLEPTDFVGKYEIDTQAYPGEQANWQHAHFEIYITEDSIHLNRLENGRIWLSYSCPIEFTKTKSARVAIKSEKPVHHILSSHPTIYRSHSDFILVFNSPEWQSVFFKKVD